MTTSRSAKKHEDILRAGRELFLEKGFAAASVDEIAARAEVSKRTLYNHFPTKEALFHEVVDANKPKAHLEVPPYDPSRSLADQLSGMLEERFVTQLGTEQLRTTRMLMSEILRSPELLRDLESSMREVDASLVPWIEAAIADGKLRAIDAPEVISRMFWGGVSSLFWRRMFSGGEGLPRDWHDRRDRWIALFLNYYATRD